MARVYKNYDCTPETLQETLDRYGVAVIPNLIPKEELEVIKEKMFVTLTEMTQGLDVPFNKDNQNTWKSILTMQPLHGMLFQSFGLGHAQFAWDIRQDPRVNEIFAKLWGVNGNELLSSFDGVSISFPPEITGSGWHTADWYHSDQRFSFSGLHTVQGLVGCYDVNEGDATLTVLEGSNNFHREFSKTFGLTKSDKDWYKLNRSELQFYADRGCEKRFIQATAGSLVLWDSRTIHAGSGPVEGRTDPNTRLVVYVCQKPRSAATIIDIANKRKAFREKIQTNHDPCNVTLFSKFPKFCKGRDRVDAMKILPPSNAVLTPLGRNLVGF